MFANTGRKLGGGRADKPFEAILYHRSRDNRRLDPLDPAL